MGGQSRAILNLIWFLRDKGVELRDGSKFGIRGGVGANVEGGRMGVGLVILPQPRKKCWWGIQIP